MKYQLEIDINLPRDRVIELFNNVDNLYHWQPDLIAFEHISGEPGQKGAKSKMRYKMGKRECEMVETITVSEFPNEFSGTYAADGCWNEVKNYFSEVDENTTRWVSENQFKMGLLLRIMALFMPGMFKKQSWKYMEQFKAFAETNSEVKSEATLESKTELEQETELDSETKIKTEDKVTPK